MRKNKLISLLLVLCLIFTCFGCDQQKTPDDGGKTPDEGQVEPKTPDAETAMNNFVAKLEKANYVIEPASYVKTTVYSPDLVYFTTTPGSFLNMAFMTLKDETFKGRLDEEDITYVEFEAPGKAIDAVASMLPNNWIDIADGNMWELFYNNVDNPLEFTSKDVNVKTTLLGLAGYSTQALDVMEDVHVLLDAEDPTEVRFTAAVGDLGMIHYEDLDLTLKFGVATSDPRIDNWLKNPIYPDVRTGWDEYDLGSIESVFMRDYGEMTVPFPEFASYALIFDKNAYMDRSEVEIHDAHATEKNVEDYIKLLESKGYQKVTKKEDDGTEKTVYRMMLREAKHAYAELEVNYDEGFALIGRMFYDEPIYEGIAAFNEPLKEMGFPELNETDLFDGWYARQTAGARTESWQYFFNYRSYFYIPLQYEDHDAALAYFQEYGERLKASGYKETFAPNGATYENSNGFKSFKYMFSEENDTVALTIKDEISLTPDEANRLIKQYNLPEANIHGDIAARNQTIYYHGLSGFKGLHMMIYQPFATTHEAEAFLDTYVAEMEALGYEPVNPISIGCYRDYAYMNDALAKYVGFDLINYSDHAQVTLEYHSIDLEDSTVLNSILNRH